MLVFEYIDVGIAARYTSNCSMLAALSQGSEWSGEVTSIIDYSRCH